MEENKTTMTNRQGKRKIHPLSGLSIGGEGGIAGLCVFGGALAIAGFMAVASFAKESKPKRKPQQVVFEEHGCNKNEEEHDTTQSLTSIIQHGDATCRWTSNMSINQVSELVSSQSLILEEKSELKKRNVEERPSRFDQQEIVFSDSSHPGSAASSNENGVAEECMVMNGLEKDEEPQDDITSSEKGTEIDDDDVSEKATGTTFMDYNEEPVWSAELIQRRHANQKFKGDDHVCCQSDHIDDLDHDEAMAVPNRATLNQNLNFFMVPNNQPLTWVFPLLLLALLLLLVILLTHRPQESFYVLDEANSVVKRI